MVKVRSTVKINTGMISRLNAAVSKALEQTGEALQTEVVQAQVMPRDTGAMQNESTFVDYSQSDSGKVSIVTSTPYARRLYYHPEYHFDKSENPDAKGNWYEDWMETGSRADFVPKAFSSFYTREAGL